LPETSELKLYNALASKMTGAFAGVGVKLLSGNDFLGAATGTLLAVSMEAVGNDFIQSILTQRPKVRVARAISVAHVFLVDRMESGFTLRDDDFVRRVENARSPAEEVTEAALQVAMSSAQERKVDFIGYMLAYIATDSTIDLDTAHMLIDLAETLSFRSFMLLKMAAENDGVRIPARPRSGSLPPSSLHSLMVDAYGLFRQGLVDFRDAADADDTYLIDSVEQVDGGRMHLTATGRLLGDCLGLPFADDKNPTYMSTLHSLVELSTYAMNRSVIDGGKF
jgi:hypothetical protein